MKNIFIKDNTDEVLGRINSLTTLCKPLWGKMNVAQMLAHCNVTYEMVYADKYKKATGVKRFILKLVVKNAVVNDKPYKRNLRTAPAFLIVDEREFEKEKKRLVDYILKTQNLGEKEFNGKESNSFGLLTSKEWNNLFYKHLDHHLNQFGV